MELLPNRSRALNPRTGIWQRQIETLTNKHEAEVPSQEGWSRNMGTEQKTKTVMPIIAMTYDVALGLWLITSCLAIKIPMDWSTMVSWGCIWDAMISSWCKALKGVHRKKTASYRGGGTSMTKLWARKFLFIVGWRENNTLYIYNMYIYIYIYITILWIHTLDRFWKSKFFGFHWNSPKNPGIFLPFLPWLLGRRLAFWAPDWWAPWDQKSDWLLGKLRGCGAPHCEKPSPTGPSDHQVSFELC